MKTVQHCVRISPAQHRMLVALAELRGETNYKMMVRAIGAGLAALSELPKASSNVDDIIGEVASISTRIVDVERMLDRALFTSCAAYCYSRSAASGQRKTDEAITAEITAAYDRQRRLSREARS